MTPDQIIEKILLGGLLGLLGQGIRMVIGLKKLSDTNAFKESIEGINAARLLISLFIGFVAGALYVLVNGFENQSAQNTTTYVGSQFIFTVMAAGYAGSDFIEGLFNTYIAKMPTVNSGDNTVAIVNSNNPPAVPQPPVNTTTVVAGTALPATDTPQPPTDNDTQNTGANPT